MEPRHPSDMEPRLEALLASTPYANGRFLGRGAMGVVYVVEHRFLGRKFALKRLHPRYAEQPQYGDRMRVEAQALARLEHPNVVDVVDFWVDADRRPCVVMELLEGRTLAAELRERKRLPVAEALDVTCQALSALAAAHEIGIVHRDVKPENLFLHETPSHGRVLKVLDFGMARVLPRASPRAPSPLLVPTDTNAVMGSPRFISPEAARGERVDARGDVYSMGVVLYAMLAGRGPFDAGEETPRPPSDGTPEALLPRLDALVLRAIEADPESRFADGRAFLAEVKQAARAARSEPPR